MQIDGGYNKTKLKQVYKYWTARRHPPSAFSQVKIFIIFIPLLQILIFCVQMTKTRNYLKKLFILIHFRQFFRYLNIFCVVLLIFQLFFQFFFLFFFLFKLNLIQHWFMLKIHIVNFIKFLASNINKMVLPLGRWINQFFLIVLILLVFKKIHDKHIFIFDFTSVIIKQAVILEFVN